MSRLPRRRPARLARLAARPPRPATALGAGALAWWAGRRGRATALRLAWMAALVPQVAAAVAGSPVAAAASAAWVLAGAVALAAGAALDLQLSGRADAHRRSGAPSAGGWRLLPGATAGDPETLLLVDLTAWLHSRARLVERPARGTRGRRLTYERGLRDLSRDWARARALPVRRGDRTARELVRRGVIREAAVSQAVAWRLAFSRVEDALAALERSSGARLVDWTLGPDPRAES